MSLPVRVATLIVAFAAVVAGAAFVVIHYMLGNPPVQDFTSLAKGGQVSLTLQTTPETTVSSRPDWVSYFIKNPQTGKWEHSTLLKLAANTQVNVTILAYDGCTPLRNPLWSKVTGTIGNVEYLNGNRSPRWTRGRPVTFSTRSRSRASASACRSPRRRR